MDSKQFEKYNIPKEKFAFASTEGRLHDQKLDTKPVSFMRDAFNRFKKNKASLAAAIIILLLLLYAIIGPWLFSSSYQDSYVSETILVRYKELLPRLKFMTGSGIWDGSKVVDVTKNRLNMYEGIAKETGHNPIQRVIKEYTTKDEMGKDVVMYKVRINSYFANFTRTKILFLYRNR